MPKRCLPISFFLVVLAVWPSFGQGSSSATTSSSARGSRWQVVEKLICEKDPAAPVLDDEDTLSADLQKVAWRARRGEKRVALVNGVPEKLEFDELQWLLFSPDSRRLAYQGKSDRQWVQVLDGQTHAAKYDEMGFAVFSPDSRRFAYVGKKDGKWRTVIDGVEQPSFDDVGRLRFSDDSRHTAYPAKVGKKWHVVRDGQLDPAEFSNICHMLFSPEGRRFAFVAERKSKHVVVIDGKEGPMFDIVGGLRFSSDSAHVVYSGVVTHGDRGTGSIVLDGVPGPGYEGTHASSWSRGGVELVEAYFDDLRPSWHGVSSAALSADGTRLAHAASQGKRQLVVLFDGKPGPVLEFVGPPRVSPDGVHVAYLGEVHGIARLFLDGNPVCLSPGEGMDFATGAVFSQDGTAAAAVGVWGGTWYERGGTRRARRKVFASGRPTREFNAKQVAGLSFSKEGKHLAYFVHEVEGGGSFVVVDQQDGKHYDSVTLPAFHEDGSLTYVARAGRAYYSVTMTPE